MERCDCLNRCGDDAWVHRGRAAPCERMRIWRARPQVIEVERLEGRPDSVVVTFTRRPEAEDLNALRRFDNWPSP